MTRARLWRVLMATACLGLAVGASAGAEANRPRRTIVVTYSVLHAVVRDLAGDGFDVKLSIPNGMDPHDWEPSARDIETLAHADLVITNGLGLEAGMQRAIEQARRRGVRIFTAADHVTIRRVGPSEGIPSGDPDQAVGAQDPHLWMDPIAMKSVARALAKQLAADCGVDLSGRVADLEQRLDALDEEIKSSVAAIPPARRKLVTGHESLGYFAQRYGLQLVGAVVPSLSTQAESSAASLVALKALIARTGVKVVFTEVGTPRRLTEALARESGVKCVPLTTHAVPADGSYFTFMRDLAGSIASSLR